MKKITPTTKNKSKKGRYPYQVRRLTNRSYPSNNIIAHNKGDRTLFLRNNIQYINRRDPNRVNLSQNGLGARERTAIYSRVNPILTYSEILKQYGVTDVVTMLLNLICDGGGAVLVAREIVYLIDQRKGMTSTSRAWTSINILTQWLDRGIIKEVCDYDRKRGLAREAMLTRTEKKISLLIENMARDILDSNEGDLLDRARQTILVKNTPNRIVLTDIEKQADQDYKAAPLKWRQQYDAYKGKVQGYKTYQATRGITVELLERIIHDHLPGQQAKRKDKILTTLIEEYGLTDRICTRIPQRRKPDDTIKKLRTRIASIHGLAARVTNIKINDNKQDARTLISETSKDFVKGFQPYRDLLNKAIRNNLRNYKDKDHIDKRQRLKMLQTSSPLPLAYEHKGITSPRVYSQEADNLFACRKGMRIAALKGLGAVDIDIKSCHTQLLLDEWGEHLPTLKAAMEKGTLWDLYRTHYDIEGLPFHKKAIKAMHYASILGGGMNAFQQAIHRYNLDNPDEQIIDKNRYIEAHKRNPIYKEIRKLLRHLGKEWIGKEIQTATGEKIRVTGYRKYKDRNGKIKIDPGNLLTTLSTYLQAKETLIMSHFIQATQALYVPLLWQHDGITAIPLSQSIDEQVMGAFKEAVVAVTGKEIDIEMEVVTI